jgi:hypothetical protein
MGPRFSTGRQWRVAAAGKHGITVKRWCAVMVAQSPAAGQYKVHTVLRGTCSSIDFSAG